MSKLAVAAWGWLVVVLAAAAFLSHGLVTRTLSVETNLLALLPETEKDPVIEELVHRAEERTAEHIVIALGHRDRSSALRAGRLFATALADSKNLQFSSAQTSQLMADLLQATFDSRELILSPTIREKLAQGPKVFTDHTLSAYFSPVADLSKIDRDPLLLHPAYLQELLSMLPPVAPEEGLLVATRDGYTYVLFEGTLKGSSFSTSIQQAAIADLQATEAKVRAVVSDLRIHRSGVVWFAERSARTTRSDISTIGTISTIIVSLLLLAAFSSFRPLILSYVALGVAFIIAGSISFLVFPSLHAITLGFGTTLIGVCVDYPLHYFCHALGGFRSRREVLHAVLPGVTLGMLTSLLSFFGLIITPFPGLKQMALFSSVGILAAYLTVVFWFPYLGPASASRKSSLLQPLASRMLQLLASARGMGKRGALAAIAALLLYSAFQLKTEDDIRSLDHLPADLIADERLVRQLLRLNEGASFFIVEGADPEQLLQREEILLKTLRPLQIEGMLGGVRAISQLFPSMKTQHENIELLRKVALETPMLFNGLRQTAGIAESALTQLATRLEQATPISLKQLLEGPLRPLLDPLYLGTSGRGVASIVLLSNLSDTERLQRIGATIEGATFINKISDTTDLLRRYRLAASFLSAGCYCLIVVVVLLRYGFRKGSLVMLPPLMGSAFAFTALAVSGVELNLFSSFGLLIVLGLGVDYGIFFAEEELPEEATMLAVLLSAFSNALAFGLLLLSSSPILIGFGTTVCAGIIGTLIAAPLARGNALAQ